MEDFEKPTSSENGIDLKTATPEEIKTRIGELTQMRNLESSANPSDAAEIDEWIEEAQNALQDALARTELTD